MEHTRESLLAELQALAAEQGPDVTLFAFRQATGIPPYYIYDRWGNWTNLRKAAGLPVRSHPGPVYSDDELLGEYHHAAVQLNDFPTHTEFNRQSDRCWNTLETRFGKQPDVQQKYREWLATQGLEQSPLFLKGCPADCEPTTVPGVFVVDNAQLLAIKSFNRETRPPESATESRRPRARRSDIGDCWRICLCLLATLSLFVPAGTLTMPLFPPPQLVEHPADLVIDVFGTFLGKRSERMVVRWRDLARPTSLPPIASPPDTDTVATLTEAKLPTPDLPELDDSEPADSPFLRAVAPHPADHAIDQLRQLWAAESPIPQFSPPTPPHRLRNQLDPIAEPAASPSAGDWHERVVPLSRLRSVTVSGRGVTVSSDLIAALVERGIALSFLSGRGQPVAQLSAPGLGGTVQTRRSQLAAYTSPLGVLLAVEFIRGKLRNQKHQLQYSGKYLKSTAPERFERLSRKIAAIANLRQQLRDFEAPNLDQVRDKLMGYEGTGARLYWEGVALLLEDRIAFPGRQTRGALDPVNSALNYGYGILYGQVSAAVVNAGLEIYAGFLHVDRPGKPALVLDLVEEFRAPIVDRAILAIVNQGMPLATDDHGLTPTSRKLVADRVLERLATTVPYEGKRWPLGTIIQNQARHLAVAVRGERTYRSFASRW